MAITTCIALTVFFNPVALSPLYKPSSRDESHSVVFNPEDKEDNTRGSMPMHVKKRS